jgi:hypothetical protein
MESRKYKKDGTLYANQRENDESLDEYQDRLMSDIAENPMKYFSRGEVVRFEEEEKDAQHDLWQLTKAIRESQLSNRWPRNPDACVAYGRMCEFFSVCTRTASLDDPILFRVEENVHAELSKLEV